MDDIFQGRVFGAATVGERGQIVIPAELRKSLGISPGDQLIIFSKPDRKVIGLMPEKDFNQFLQLASKLVSKYESASANKHV
jgi:AbrB family looped-hinge helix DNA binding protein